MADEKAHPSGETQGSRRAKYGLNVLVGCAAALALVVLLNWIGERQFIRKDFSATRRYSLSEQTLRVLGGLDGDYQVVSLFSRSSPYIEQARDLIEEYGRYGKSVTADHIDAGRELGRLEALFASLHARYAEQLAPTRDAIDGARRVLDRTLAEAAGAVPVLRGALEDPTLPDGELKGFLRDLAAAMARFDSQIDALVEQVERDLGSSLPAYRAAKDTLEQVLSELDTNVFALTIDRFAVAATQGDTPDAIKDALLGLSERFKAVQGEIGAALATLRAAERVEGYENLRTQINTPDPVVVIGPSQVRVLAITELFREPDPEQVQPGEEPQLRFQGEERITGALVSMGMTARPMVVFVGGSRGQVIAPGGAYSQVAERLRRMNFDVRQWSPGPQPGPLGQPMPPAPAPEPEPDQTAVWIALPGAAPNPMDPMASLGGTGVAEKIQERMGAGDGAMVLLSLSPMAQFGSSEPMSALLEPWGITPQLDRLILRQVQLPDRRTRATPQLDVTDWPCDVAITSALRGSPGVFVQACPLILGPTEDSETKTWPLATVSGQDLWAERDVQGTGNPTLDPATAGGPFVIGAAGQRGDERLVVVADPGWATDQIVNYGALGEGTAELFGALFPANAELFLNSVYWLAGLDELIAASPRTQDIRRVEAISRSGLAGLQWGLLAGMPLAVAAVGAGVWHIRRAG